MRRLELFLNRSVLFNRGAQVGAEGGDVALQLAEAPVLVGLGEAAAAAGTSALG